MYALHALISINAGGRTDEATIEVPDLDAVCDRIREMVAACPGFRAITLLHVEDLPLTLEGAD